MREEEASLLVAPLFHTGGLKVNSLMIWQKCGHVVLHRSFNPNRCLADIQRHRHVRVPATLLFPRQQPDFVSADLSSLQTMDCDGAPVPEPLMRLYADRGIPINQGSGLTETAPFVTLLALRLGDGETRTAGKPPMFSEVHLVDAVGHEIRVPRMNGEVITRGPNIMKGYWNNPEATEAAIDIERWFYTGDLGFFDEDGFLFIAGCLKEMVISGDENVYPAEIESVLYDHPFIA